MEMKQLSLNLDVPSVLVIKPESLGEVTWGRLLYEAAVDLSSTLELASMTLRELPSGMTEIVISGALPSSNTFLSALRNYLATPSF